MLIVSACLAGIHCRYDGKCKTDPEICRLVAEGQAIPVCPEQLGGLTTPRPPAEIQGCEKENAGGCDVLDGSARVRNKAGEDVTEQFVRGAKETLQIAKLVGAKEAILQDGSPSCGSTWTYNGSFTGSRIRSEGVTTSLLRQAGINVRSKKDD